MLLRFRGRYRIRRGPRLGFIRQNERSFAWPEQLQLFADLQLLFGGALLKPANAIAPVIVFALQVGVVLFQLADLAPFFHQSGDSLGASQGHVAVKADQPEDEKQRDTSDEIMQSQCLWALTFVYNPVLSKDPVEEEKKF